MPPQTPRRESEETPAERIHRNWNELLQELRVTQTGVQILFAFLLILPFQQRFDLLDTQERWLYVAVVILITISAVLNLAPVITHRFLFAQHQKDIVVKSSDLIAKLSFITLGLALVGALGLVMDLVAGRTVAYVVVGCIGLLILGVWVIMPTVLRASQDEDDPPAY